jgi:hypothetical protein
MYLDLPELLRTIVFTDWIIDLGRVFKNKDELKT